MGAWSTSTTSLTCSIALDAIARADPPIPVALRALDRGVEDIVDEGGLAGAAHARDDGEQAERDRHVDALQVVLARGDDAQLAAARACAGWPEWGSRDRRAGTWPSATAAR